jgi:hypothetical protein
MPLAHAGHWLAETLYVLPVVVVVTWISIKSILDRRRARRGDPAGWEPSDVHRD